MKNNQRAKHSNEDFEGKNIEKQEENRHSRNLNQELEEQIEGLKEDNTKSQVERFKKSEINNTLLENIL